MNRFNVEEELSTREYSASIDEENLKKFMM
jgi:hypothetical protein